MGLRAGQTNNPNGRPKGVGNKLNNDLKARIAQIIENGFETIEADIQALEPKDRVNAYLKLTEYLVPKLRSISVDTEEKERAEKPSWLIDNLSDDETQEIEP